MPAQRHDAAAGPPDVAQQKLQDRRRADDLHALGLVRLADRVAERRRPLRAGVVGQRVGDLVEQLRRDAADLLAPSPACSAGKCRRNAWKTQRGCSSVGSRGDVRRVVAALELPAFVLVMLPLLLPAREEPRAVARRRGNRSRRMLEALV